MQLVKRKLHAKSGECLSRSGKIKNIGLRVTPEKYAAVEARAEQLDLNIQQTVEHALDRFLSDAGVVIATTPKPPRRGSVPETLQLLLDGQSTILRVLGEITRTDAGKPPIPGGQEIHQPLDDGEFADIPADIAVLVREDSAGSGSNKPLEKDRPPKQTKVAPTRTGRRKH